MAHKGYTIPYFIEYFSSIPDHQWCTNDLQKQGTKQHCAIGHALRRGKSSYRVTRTSVYLREEALVKIFGSWNNIAYVNDAQGIFSSLGKTPRGRILRALRNLKRTGNLLGNR
jgi:hypothetical protein